MMRHLGAFTAQGSDGHRYTVNIYAEFIRVAAPEGSGEVEGVQHLRLADGRPVTRLARGEYAIDGAGVTLRSHAADAP